MTAAEPPPCAASYARVSYEDQWNDLSVPTKIEACGNLAIHQGATNLKLTAERGYKLRNL